METYNKNNQKQIRTEPIVQNNKNTNPQTSEKITKRQFFEKDQKSEIEKETENLAEHIQLWKQNIESDTNMEILYDPAKDYLQERFRRGNPNLQGVKGKQMNTLSCYYCFTRVCVNEFTDDAEKNLFECKKVENLIIDCADPSFQFESLRKSGDAFLGKTQEQRLQDIFEAIVARKEMQIGGYKQLSEERDEDDETEGHLRHVGLPEAVKELGGVSQPDLVFDVICACCKQVVGKFYFSEGIYRLENVVRGYG